MKEKSEVNKTDQVEKKTADEVSIQELKEKYNKLKNIMRTAGSTRNVLGSKRGTASIDQMDEASF